MTSWSRPPARCWPARESRPPPTSTLPRRRRRPSGSGPRPVPAAGRRPAPRRRADRGELRTRSTGGSSGKPARSRRRRSWRRTSRRRSAYEAAGLPSRPLGSLLPQRAAAPEHGAAAARRGGRRHRAVQRAADPGIRSVAPALALGNAVVLKPDPRTAVSGGVVDRPGRSRKPGCPRACCTCCPAAPRRARRWSRDPHVRVISFTGSTAAGRKVGEAGARHLKRVHLELGGNSALVVLDDADLDLAVSAGAFGSFLHQGQICMTTGRHLVHEKIADAYVEALAAKADAPAGRRPGRASRSPSARSSTRASATSRTDWSRPARTRGRRVAAGGTYEDLFYRPTVLTELTTATPAFAQEVFGPVAPVMRFRTLDEVAALAADGRLRALARHPDARPAERRWSWPSASPAASSTSTTRRSATRRRSLRGRRRLRAPAPASAGPGEHRGVHRDAVGHDAQRDPALPVLVPTRSSPYPFQPLPVPAVPAAAQPGRSARARMRTRVASSEPVPPASPLPGCSRSPAWTRSWSSPAAGHTSRGGCCRGARAGHGRPADGGRGGRAAAP